MNPLRIPRISRRVTLQWLAAVMAASDLPQYGLARAYKPAPKPIPKGYGTDPDLNHPVVPWSRSMTAHQLHLTAVLADLLLPGTASAPKPSALGIPDFVDEWISAPYPQQKTDRTVILDGLKWIDAEAGRRWQSGFLRVDAQRQQRILDATVEEYRSARSKDVAKQASWSAAIEPVRESFFPRFRFIVVGAYYTTPEGFKDIGYIGNVPLLSYPPITRKEKEILDEQLQKLGINP